MKLGFLAAVFALVLILQTGLWSLVTLGDARLWEGRLLYFSQEITTQPLHLQQPHYSQHPGMVIVILGAALHLPGLSLPAALKATVIIINTLAITSLALVIKRLQPESPWWWLTLLIATLHPLYLFSTPTNATAAPLLVLLFFLAVLISRLPLLSLILAWGFVAGVAFTDRLLDTVFFGLPLFIFLAARLRRRLLPACFSLLAAIIVFDPFVWQQPLTHFYYLLQPFTTYLTHTFGYETTLANLVLLFPLSFLSFFLACLLLFLPRLLPLPRYFLTGTLIFTIAALIIFRQFGIQSIRYYFPLILLWELLLPLFVWQLVQHSLVIKETFPRWHRLFSFSSAFLVVIAEWSILAYYYLQPGPLGLI